MMRSRQDRGIGPNDYGSGHGYPQTEGCNLDTTTFDQLLRDSRMEDNSSFFNYMRMEPLMFDRVSPKIQKSDTHFRKALEPGPELERIMRLDEVESWRERDEIYVSAVQLPIA